MRLTEAFHFARHLCYPRAFIKLCEEMGIPLTETNIALFCGGFGTHITDLQSTPGSVIDSALNRHVKNTLRTYVEQLFASGAVSLNPTKDEPVLDLSSYMEGYEE
jgi:hypothetical protein